MSVLDFMKSAASKAASRFKPARLKYIGKSKTHRTCDQCGKTDLAETVAFENSNGARVYMGSECAKGARDQAESQELMSEDSESLGLEYYKPHDFKLSDQLLESIHTKLEGSVGGYKVYSVDGALIRAKVDIDHVAGGNGARYKYVPLDEIWVENLYQPVDFAATLLHEIVETDLMLNQGQSYDEAHETASRREAPLRRMMLKPGQAVKSRQAALKLVEKELEDIEAHDDRTTKLSKEQITKFREMAYAQRGEPEDAMNRVQDAINGGVPGLTYIVEHIGDLTNRMAKDVGFNSAGYEYVRDKVESSERSLGYLSRSSYEDQMKKAAARRGINYEDYHQKIKSALKDYANAHSQLPVYNRAQWLARQAAIDVGNERFAGANVTLSKIQDMLGSEEIWWRHATEYSPGGWKP